MSIEQMPKIENNENNEAVQKRNRLKEWFKGADKSFKAMIAGIVLFIGAGAVTQHLENEARKDDARGAAPEKLTVDEEGYKQTMTNAANELNDIKREMAEKDAQFDNVDNAK